MVGKPIIKGTRITVELILRQLAQGLTAKDVIANYPHLKPEDVQAAINCRHLISIGGLNPPSFA